MRKPFEGIFGNTPELRMLEFLLPLEGVDFNITELAEEVGISRPTAQKIVKKFLEHGILKVSAEKGGVKYYEIDPDSPFVRLIDEINNVLIAEMVGPEVMNEVERIWSQRNMEELGRLIVGFTKEIKSMITSETEKLPTPSKSIEEDESMVFPPKEPAGIYVSLRDINAADDVDILAGGANAA